MLALAVLVFALFFAIEILPLHFGPKRIPWPEILPLVKERVPIMTLIAFGVAFLVGTRNEKE